MHGTSGGWRAIRVVAGLGLVVVLGVSQPHQARADRIVLRSGGEIKGHLLDDPADPAMVRVLISHSSEPLRLPRERVEGVIEEEDAFDAYFRQKEQAGETAQARYDLGVWCEQNGVPGLAKAHYREALERDPAFEPAHQKLGHVEYDGKWMTFDERAEAQGLVREKGRWVLEKADEGGAGLTAAQAEWSRKIQVLSQQVRVGTAGERQEAEARLGEIRDAAAVPALVKTFGRSSSPVDRARLVRLLEPIAGPEARDALLLMLIDETEASLWEQVMSTLERRRDEGRAPFLIRALKSDQPRRVERAAEALARFGERSAVPALVDVLVRTEVRTNWVPVPARPVGPGANDSSYSSGMGIPYVRNVRPVVGPGVVAFKPEIGYVNSGVALGRRNPGVAPGPSAPLSMPQRVRVPVPNPGVREALQVLTNQDFRYDVRAWKRWLQTEFRVEDAPRRQVNQP